MDTATPLGTAASLGGVDARYAELRWRVAVDPAGTAAAGTVMKGDHDA